ncbi:hypothetical protein FACS189450_07550 [Spirochaetia bacterium]|nr:hypothetical protein FACS189450_07550 [Spirochaetia bacterium]
MSRAVQARLRPSTTIQEADRPRRAGKRGGFRAILFFRHDERLIFYYVFAKADRNNIDDDELREFKATAKMYLEYTENQLEARIKEGWIRDVKQ